MGGAAQIKYIFVSEAFMHIKMRGLNSGDIFEITFYGGTGYEKAFELLMQKRSKEGWWGRFSLGSCECQSGLILVCHK